MTSLTTNQKIEINSHRTKIQPHPTPRRVCTSISWLDLCNMLRLT